ncbi:hypothetical protein ACIBFB_07370 [Nocardiopsis sp. NPDC050513]
MTTRRRRRAHRVRRYADPAPAWILASTLIARAVEIWLEAVR